MTTPSPSTPDAAVTLSDAEVAKLRRKAESAYFVGGCFGGGYWSDTFTPTTVLTLLDALDAARLAARERADADQLAVRDQGLDEYLRTMDCQGESQVYTLDFRDGFRHALAMLAAYESEGVEGRVRPEVSVASRLALARRAALADTPAPEQRDPNLSPSRNNCNGCVNAALRAGTTQRPLRPDGHDVDCDTPAPESAPRDEAAGCVPCEPCGGSQNCDWHKHPSPDRDLRIAARDLLIKRVAMATGTHRPVDEARAWDAFALALDAAEDAALSPTPPTPD